MSPRPDGKKQYGAATGDAVCTNSLVVSVGIFPVWRIADSGDVLDDVVRAAQEIGERFGRLATVVERMERTVLLDSERLEFALQAYVLRFPDD